MKSLSLFPPPYSGQAEPMPTAIRRPARRAALRVQVHGREHPASRDAILFCLLRAAGNGARELRGVACSTGEIRLARGKLRASAPCPHSRRFEAVSRPVLPISPEAPFHTVGLWSEKFQGFRAPTEECSRRETTKSSLPTDCSGHVKYQHAAG